MKKYRIVLLGDSMAANWVSMIQNKIAWRNGASMDRGDFRIELIDSSYITHSWDHACAIYEPTAEGFSDTQERWTRLLQPYAEDFASGVRSVSHLVAAKSNTTFWNSKDSELVNKAVLNGKVTLFLDLEGAVAAIRAHVAKQPYRFTTEEMTQTLVALGYTTCSPVEDDEYSQVEKVMAKSGSKPLFRRGAAVEFLIGERVFDKHAGYMGYIVTDDLQAIRLWRVGEQYRQEYMPVLAAQIQLKAKALFRDQLEPLRPQPGPYSMEEISKVALASTYEFSVGEIQEDVYNALGLDKYFKRSNAIAAWTENDPHTVFYIDTTLTARRRRQFGDDPSDPSSIRIAQDITDALKQCADRYLGERKITT